MKKQIQETVLELIVQKGLKFTMNDVAEKQGISKRTIYEHFESKQHMIETIVDDAIEEVKQREQEIFQSKELSYKQKLAKVLSIVPSGLSFGDTALLEQMKRFAPNEWVKVDQLLQNGWDIVQQIIELGIENGEFRPLDVPSVIQLLRGASTAIFDPDFHAYNVHSLEKVVETMVDIVTHGLMNEKE
ncbi:MAG TPA: TetR/AcrR family transcriptional regulator [Bacillus bacterium]|uniref:TetR family transcriptional regulator n=1 Tax=Siminovitchia fordii TaxID=254759 RepID=A0ABQ4K362_9BACI|nr:TetR/AcrR family transcriptional regulator [Siminovitchia fordii]GIN20187.1 TetR family transcriptional regulator [Siminovitchia fordii]HBZ09258.1 TetR/AcrR family transcriptional regulator [Bacillus sp. (in: firmicutes)]